MRDRLLLTVHGVSSDSRRLAELAGRVADSTGHVPRAVNFGEQRPLRTINKQLRFLIFKMVSLDLRLARASSQHATGEAPVIDVIAHSFGTLAVYHALVDGGAAIGKLVLLGSIMDQRVEWDSLVDAGRVECPPLNIVRPFDGVVRHSRWVTGDVSGVRGFSPNGTCRPIDHFEDGGHNDYENDADLIARFLTGGLTRSQAIKEGDFSRALGRRRRAWLALTRCLRFR